MIGQDVDNINPYTTQRIAPIELMILRWFTFLRVNEIMRTSEAKYPTHSV